METAFYQNDPWRQSAGRQDLYAGKTAILRPEKLGHNAPRGVLRAGILPCRGPAPKMGTCWQRKNFFPGTWKSFSNRWSTGYNSRGFGWGRGAAFRNGFANCRRTGVAWDREERTKQGGDDRPQRIVREGTEFVRTAVP